jgi:hypothetical protein
MMEPNEIKAFPDDFTVWIDTHVADNAEGSEVKRIWHDFELTQLARVREVMALIEFEWSFVLIEFRVDNGAMQIGYKLHVRIVNVAPPAEVTYIFRLNDENRIVEVTKYGGEIQSNTQITSH